MNSITWILCTEKLPPMYHRKIVTYQSRGERYVVEACLRHKGSSYVWYSDVFPYENLDVIAWADFPAPYSKPRCDF